MNVVITGATGAIGRALIEKCLEKHDKVLIIAHKGSKRINELLDNACIEIVFADVSEYKTLDVSEYDQYDVFYHFAWAGTTGEARNDMALQTENIQGCIESVQLAKRLGCHTFVGAGSQAEYGRKEGILTPDLATNPENGYGMAKLCAGQMTRVLCESLGMKHIWTRILSVYGPYDGSGSMVMSGLSKMLRNEETSFTKGEQIWDFLYAGDAAEALYLLGKFGVDGKIYCIGSGLGRPLSEYIRIMYELSGSTAKLGLGKVPYADGQVMHLQADISELQKDIGFTPKISFENGIKKTIAYIQARKTL